MNLTSLNEPINDTFTISHSISDSWTMSNYHFHDSFEILFSLSSTTKLFIEDTMYDVEKGDLFLINNMELHRVVAPPNVCYDRYIISFDPSYIESYSSEQSDLLKCFFHRKSNLSYKIHLSEDQIHAFLALLKRIEFYHKNAVFGSDIYKKITFIELLLLINSFNHSSTDARKSSSDFKKIEQVLAYINQNLSETLTLDVLSNVFYLNKYYLSHMFKENTGFSVNEYIINRRILKSRELLKQDLPVYEVSEMVGFNNYCHFIRTFKSLVGISPKQYALKETSI